MGKLLRLRRFFFWCLLAGLVGLLAGHLGAKTAPVKATGLPPIKTVFVILEENSDLSVIRGSSAFPNFNALMTRGAVALNYHNAPAGQALHPSEPNYIWLEAGSNQLSDYTFTSDSDPGAANSTRDTNHLVTRLNRAGISWMSYQENMPAVACPIVSSSPYAAKHNPFVFFQDVSGPLAPGTPGTPSSSSAYCGAHMRNFSRLAADLAGNTVARYNFITPNLCDDMHNSGCGATADNWIKNTVAMIQNSAAYQDNGVIFITWDEGGSGNNPIGMIALSPFIKPGTVDSSTYYSHGSLLRTIEEIFGVPLLGRDDSREADLSNLFSGGIVPPPPPPPPPPSGDPVIAAAGDIACGVGSTGAACQQQATANLISNLNPAASAVLVLGDNQYEQGSLSDFQNFYDRSWGKFKGITKPTPGNHEYLTSGAAGYFGYFGSAAGSVGHDYYSYDVGQWHWISLDTDCSQVGGCTAGSPQYNWLSSDLAAHPNTCIGAYFHHPMFSSGQEPHNAGTDPLFGLLYRAHAAVVLSGHDHDYERFAPQNPSALADPLGVRQFVVGTGGRNHTPRTSNASNSQFADFTNFGILKMVLHSTSYDWQFISISGSVLDSGTANCPGVIPGPNPSNGDFNHDGHVNILDFVQFVLDFPQSLSLYDFDKMVSNFGK